MSEEIAYRAAAYLRLSREDKGAACAKIMESNSITSQRAYIEAFVRQQDKMEIYDIYTDDGYSGVSFDRPAFGRMMADIHKGRVNCVLVKDLSRFGRDYIEAGRLIQKVFPALQVRFVAIADQFDSQTANYSEISMVLPVKNFVNDAYCRDISQKVKSQQKIKRELGAYIGAFTVYGYQKHSQNKNKLLVDAYPANIVRHIFTWKLLGMSSLGIANRLNEFGILSPLEYKRLHGENYNTGFLTKAASKWSPMAVIRILSNEMYTGTMVQGKVEKVNYKVDKTISKPKEAWIRVENTHQAIIAPVYFKQVQQLLAAKGRSLSGQQMAHKYTGLLFCGDCKKPMIQRRSKAGSIAFICQTKNKGAGCSRHSIFENQLDELVGNIIRINHSLLENQPMHTKVPDIQAGRLYEIKLFEQEIGILYKAQNKYWRLLESLSSDLEQKIITAEDYVQYRSIYELQYQFVKQTREKQEALVKQLGCTATEENFDGWEFNRNAKVPDRWALLTFVERIQVYENKRVEITLRCQDAGC